MSIDRIQTPGVVAREDEQLDLSLRPRRLDEYIGQDRVREQLPSPGTGEDTRQHPALAVEQRRWPLVDGGPVRDRCVRTGDEL